jgi:peptidoglycan/LPS O-acetylase OafA/YrhL
MFAIGALAGGVQVMLAKQRNMLFDILTLVGIGLALYTIDRQLRLPNPDSWGWLGVPYGFPWFVITVGIVLAFAPSSAWLGRILDNPVSRYVARISFGIYIYHYLVIELVRLYWAPDIDHGQMADPIKFLVTSGIITAITVVAAHLSFNLIENPVIQWARNRERRESQAPTLSPAAG